MSVKPDWNREGRDWPNRRSSRFCVAGGIRWHVQVLGQGPALLLLHGAGAATHSWRDLAPALARDFTVFAPDLPGHGFTDTPGGDGLSLPGMVRGLYALLSVLDVRPALAVGHSAGAAIAVRMRLDHKVGGVVSINGALHPFPGAAGHIFPALARLLFLNSLAVEFFAWRAARPGAVARLIESTGSHIDARGLDLYGRLLRTSGHIEGALGMMSQWNLQPLVSELPRLDPPLTLMATGGDRAVPPSVARDVARVAPGSELIFLKDLGHLAHEESPEAVADVVLKAGFEP